ncbi:MAG: tetratricopeptide repeat protein [Flammeovirgaceae bacterium]|nr:tetratricopeptide repeat protein [Flammeovirgaceae bacterium]
MRSIFFLLIFASFSFVKAQPKAGTSIDQIDHLISNNQFLEALTIIEQSLASNPDKNNFQLLNKKSEVLIGLGHVALADEVLNELEAQNMPDLDRAITLTSQGYLYMNKGRNDLAIEYLQRANNEFIRINEQESKESARNLGLLGLTYLYSGKYKQAESFELRSLQIRENIFGNKSETVAAAYNDMGLVYSQTNVDMALEYYDMAMASYEEIYGKEHPKIAIVNTNIGILYQGLELYGDAINSFETSLEIWKKTYPEGHPNQAFVQRNLGQTYNLMGDQKTAMEFFEIALLGYKHAYGNKHPDIASTLNQMGYLRLNQGNFDESIRFLQESLIANVPSFSKQEQSVNPSIDEFYNGNVLLYSLHLKAKAFEAKYYEETIKLSDLLLSLNTLLLADSLIDKLRQSSVDESDKISLGAIANEVYEDGVHVAVSVGENVLKPKRFREYAFYFAEKSKAAVLQASIADADAKSFAGIPDDLLQEEKNLKADIAFHIQKLAQNS